MATLGSRLRRLWRRPFFTIRNRVRRTYWEAQAAPYERRLGVRTGLITSAFFDAEAQVVESAPVPYRMLDAIAAHMTANGVAAPRFIDIGCGSGRPLYYFADRFEELLGFEIAGPLLAAAQEQRDAARATHPHYDRIVFHNADATTALPLDRPAVLFLYNPFGPKPMARLCERLKTARHETHIYYANPVLEDVMARELGRPPDGRFRAWFDVVHYSLPVAASLGR
jgi:SAM-dependent methyltransferase